MSFWEPLPASQSACAPSPLCEWQDIPFSGTVGTTLLGLTSCFSGVGIPFLKLMHSKGKPGELAQPHFTASGFVFSLLKEWNLGWSLERNLNVLAIIPLKFLFLYIKHFNCLTIELCFPQNNRYLSLPAARHILLK